MNNIFSHVHSYHLIFAIYCIFNLIFIFKKWDFVSKALSDSGSPSALRLTGFLFANLICICEVFYTMRTGIFETRHLLYIAGTMLLLYGVIKMAEVIALKNGNKDAEVPTKAEEVVAP